MRSLTERLGKDIAGFLQNQTNTVSNAFLSLSPTASLVGANDPAHSPHQTNTNRDRSGSAVSIEDITEHFHNRNQAFLHKQELQKAKRHNTLRDLSPVRQRTTIRSNSPRPPNTRGAHRPGLASIEDDNWEEQPNSTNPSHKGRTFKNTHNSSAVNNNLPLTTNNASYKQQTSHEPPSNGNNGGPANTLAQHDYYHSRGDHRHHNHSNADNSHDDQDDSDDSSSYSNSDEESDEDDDNNTSSPYNTTEENEETDPATSSNHDTNDIHIINHHS
eukprot:4798056-Ditylum_brightwellii.AAC.1